MERAYIKEALGKKEGEKVLLKGWVHDTRDLKKVRFLVLKDISGRIQVTGVEGKTDKDTFELLDNLKRESAVEIEGELKDSKQAPGGKEVLPSRITVLAEAEDPLPIDVSDFSKTELPLRLDNRFLDLHTQKTQAIFKVQSTIMQAYREFMVNEGAIEAVFPSVIGSSSEGGTEVYKLKYFEKEAYLSQSCQLYKQQVACSMEKVFTIFTVWRAEKHNTTQHLNESRQLDYEAAFSSSKDVMDVLGRCMQHIVAEVIKKNTEDLKVLDVELKVPEIKYLPFSEVADLMKKEKIKMPKHDLSGDAEKKLGELYPDTVVFVTDWPAEGRGFYIMPKGGDPRAELTEGFDAIYQGVEISSGGQRVHIPELLKELLKKKGMDPKQFEGYIDSFKYGAPQHAGWGVGLERITMLLLGLSNIREAVMWPRDRERLTP
jgi:nondiscriminating aspartyl-tRNA synthetase